MLRGGKIERKSKKDNFFLFVYNFLDKIILKCYDILAFVA